MFIIILGLNLRTYKALSANGHTCIHVWFLLSCKWRNRYSILEMRKRQSCLPPVYFVCLCVFSDPLHLLSMNFLCCMRTLEWRLQVLIQCVCFIGQNEFMWNASVFLFYSFFWEGSKQEAFKNWHAYRFENLDVMFSILLCHLHKAYCRFKITDACGLGMYVAIEMIMALQRFSDLSFRLVHLKKSQ